MRKRISKTNLKIIAATAMSIFTLFSATVGVFAWFTGKMQEAKGTTEFAVKVNSGRLKNIYFHKCASKVIDTNNYKPSSFTFENSYCGKISYNWQTNSATYSGDAKIDMDDYSPLDFTQPLLLVFELSESFPLSTAGEISIDAKTEVEGFLGSRNSQNAPVYTLDLADATKTGVYYHEPNHDDPTKTDCYFALSSVINFYCSDTSSELYNKDAQNENTTLINTTYTYSSLRTRDTSIAEKEADPDAVVPDLSFASINNESETSSFNQEPSIYKSRANTTVKYISIIVDYYNDALDFIYSTYLGDRVLEDDYESHLEFLCDWGLEIN